jgi:hypothetical protein
VAPDPDKAGSIEQHDTDARPQGQRRGEGFMRKAWGHMASYQQAINIESQVSVILKIQPFYVVICLILRRRGDCCINAAAARGLKTPR